MKAVIIRTTSDYEPSHGDNVEVTHDWDYTRTSIRVGCKFGKGVYTSTSKGRLFSESYTKVEILEVLGDIPHTKLAYKDQTAEQRLEGEAYLEQVQSVATFKYAIPELVDTQLARNYGWVSREGVFYSGNFAQHSYIAGKVLEMLGLPYSQRYDHKMLERGYVRVTPLVLGYEMEKPITLHQKIVLDKLTKRFYKSFGGLPTLYDSYADILSLGVSDE